MSDDQPDGKTDKPDDEMGISTHVSEQSFEDYVESLLVDEHGAKAVHRQHRFDEPVAGLDEATNRVADFLVVTPQNFTWAVELENDAGDVLNGSGQARIYAEAAHDEDPSRGAVLPMLVVPADHIDRPERQLIERSGVRVWEVETPDHVDTSGV